MWQVMHSAHGVLCRNKPPTESTRQGSFVEAGLPQAGALPQQADCEEVSFFSSQVAARSVPNWFTVTVPRRENLHTGLLVCQANLLAGASFQIAEEDFSNDTCNE